MKTMNEQFLIEQIRKQSVPLRNHNDVDVLIDAVGDAKYVLLGEASHGTSEFYSLRTEISKKLIENKGFSFIAVEGDWPSCYSLNSYVKHYPGSSDDIYEVMESFDRWPTWMWANDEIISLARWLREYNAHQPDDKKIGFYGLDVYSLWKSMEAILRYLETTGSEHLQTARKAFTCFEPYSRDPQMYGVSAAFLSEDCEEEVVKLLKKMHAGRTETNPDNESALSAELNALVAVNAERYYRSMVRGGPDSWNIRDHHMVEALNRIMSFHGPDAKAIVWEHNTHIGDARATDMASEDMINVGQLLRENREQNQVYAVGFGTHRGTVIAATEWGSPMEIMTVLPAQPNS